MSNTRRLFCIVADAIPSGHPDAPDGVACKLVLFQMALSDEDARRSIAGTLYSGGWARWTFESGGEVEGEAYADADPAIVEAMSLARRDGQAMVIYPATRN
ncbi:MAG: hypothetical protein JSR45_02090 [Proteobacteria bacterium]|nr:hypothetical protein [Pseudomonadota bacterium]